MLMIEGGVKSLAHMGHGATQNRIRLNVSHLELLAPRPWRPYSLPPEDLLMAKLPPGIGFTAKSKPGYGRVLTPQAAHFVAKLHRAFEAERQQLLALRTKRQGLLDKGMVPNFPAETAAIRAGTWKVAGIPASLQDRRVEITSAPERKTAIEALNSGAKVYVADFEDSSSPTWDNMVQGQINLMDRWTGKMELIEPVSNKRYALAGKPAVLMVRPRGLHLDETHMKVDGKPVAAGLFDFGMYFFHNARTSITKTAGPYFCLSKLESYLEARLWNQVFILAQSLLGLRLGTIKAAVTIETVAACFEMDEIIFELRDHMAGLNCGHSGLIFSFIKTFSGNKSFLLPDRSLIAGSSAFLAAYAGLLVKTCHRRGCFAVGSTAAQTPGALDAEASRNVLDQLRAGQEDEARSGHDGTGVSHPDLVPAALKVFNELMPTSNHLYVAREDAKAGRKELLEIPKGARTQADFRRNIRICIHYIEAWLRGHGVISIDNVMVDTAAAEIARGQIWQWLRLELKLDGGGRVTRKFFDASLAEEIRWAKEAAGAEAYASGRFKDAIALFTTLTMSKTFIPFLTIPAGEKIRH
jgi:malate synthase